MTTTFQNRRTVREELAGYFNAESEWVSVYAYMPAPSEIIPKRSFLTVRSNGTLQDFAGRDNNPTEYQFQIDSYVLAYNEVENWSSEDAENEVDRLDMITRQVIRDNMAGINYSHLRFTAGFSDTRDLTTFDGVPYIMETRQVIARLPRGAN